MSLSAKDERIAELFAAGVSVPDIVTDTGYGWSTVYRKLRHPLIRARISELRGEQLRPILDLVRSQLQANVERLAAVRDGAEERTADRINAVKELNDFFLRLHKESEVLPRLAALEAQLAEVAGTDASTEE